MSRHSKPDPKQDPAKAVPKAKVVPASTPQGKGRKKFFSSASTAKLGPISVHQQGFDRSAMTPVSEYRKQNRETEPSEEEEKDLHQEVDDEGHDTGHAARNEADV